MSRRSIIAVILATLLSLAPRLSHANGGIESTLGLTAGSSVPSGDLGKVASLGFNFGALADVSFSEYITVGGGAEYNSFGQDIVDADVLRYGGHLKVFMGPASAGTRFFAMGGPGIYWVRYAGDEWNSAGGVRLAAGLVSAHGRGSGLSLQFSFDRAFDDAETHFFTISAGLINRGP